MTKSCCGTKEKEKITQLVVTGVPEDVAVYDLLKKHNGDVLKAEEDAKLMKA